MIEKNRMGSSLSNHSLVSICRFWNKFQFLDYYYNSDNYEYKQLKVII